MKIWKEFNSSHSSNITIIGKFDKDANATKSYEMIKDFATASWFEKYPSINEFNEYWAVNFHVDVPYIGLSDNELESGIDNEPDFEIDGSTITISHFRNNNIGGIIKLMQFAGARQIIIEQ